MWIDEAAYANTTSSESKRGSPRPSLYIAALIQSLLGLKAATAIRYCDGILAQARSCLVLAS